MRSEWQSCTLSQLFRIHRESVNPAINSSELFEHYSLPAFDATGGPQVEKGHTIESSKTLLSVPAILVSKLNPRKPRVMLVVGKSRLRRCASTEWIPYTPISNSTDLGFYKWLFSSSSFQRRLETVATGSTNSHVRVSPSETLDWKIQHPPLREQRRIGEILNTLDKAIRKTEQVVAKLQQMKRGLLHDLLTHGINENGELRDPEMHPEQFMDSDPGRIPKCWDVTAFGEVSLIIDPNPSHRYPDEVGEGVPIVSTENFRGEDSFDTTSAKRVPWAVFHQQQARCNYNHEDVVFARKGRIGFSRSYGIDCKVFSHTIVIMKPRGGTISRFLLWLSRSHVFMNGIRKRMNSNSGVPTLGVDFLGKVQVPLPSVSEQRQIAAMMDAFHVRVKDEKAELVKLLALKQGLMDDLLAGRVRVATRDEDKEE